ncbi:flowering-promoting factor 1 [Amborella trichopoda]|uniref:Flowering-promoting factor 1-like protein 1 n=1 Tax=Amborella trichopoda TaxID=13333 RepID=W1PL71_AMBTC|nr:flowering-promoting factor 1 [Amborella trichopoda]ERN07885.1 hypothetical protein AMTR_s00012p00223910 [Amborella trichopoda]|eukprot:XP_006846210.1 flowering-promoting factor 1 [Amborella trichopoda]
MSGVWVFRNGVAKLVSNPNVEPLDWPEPSSSSSSSSSHRLGGSKKRVLLHLPSNQVIGCYAELEERLKQHGWERYYPLGQRARADVIQFHRSAASVDLITLPRDFSHFKSTHMFDIVVKNRSFFEVQDRPI